ncbi:hypothetical protein [Flavobacterium sp.]|uniref:hypothetical protein n=1 Tax=Flavobacterium sp. TaxID=239 RepID=UPI002D1A0CF4|nr:hypothetical protein [Flavobacterium sp.]HSD08870.1 hypothetical protein [Flavobacterium sp.]
MNKKQVLIKVMASFLSIITCSCLSNKHENNKANTDQNALVEDSIKVKDDSLSIAILSTEGKLIKQLKYKHIEKNRDRRNRMPTYLNDIKGYPSADTIQGDFNGDGKKEKAWFKNTGFKAYEDCINNGTKKSCEGIIQFSDKSIKELKIDYCPLYIFKNEGDLNSDGKDEIGVLPGWVSSACREYSVFTLKNKRWILACLPISNSLNMREAGIVLIEKDPTQEGWAIIRESVDSYINRVEKNKIAEKYILGSSCSWSNVVEQRIKLN